MNGLLVFALAALVAAATTPVSMILARRWGVLDRPGGRRRHAQALPRLGGLAIAAGLFSGLGLAFALSPSGLTPSLASYGMLAGAVLVLILGVADDVSNLSPAVQLAGQLVAAVIAVACGLVMHGVGIPQLGTLVLSGAVAPLLTVLWLLAVMNAVNFLDGLDGLAAGVCAIAVLAFAWHLGVTEGGGLHLVPLAVAGAVLGFLPFNAAPARTFMGSSGSFLLGWCLATLSVWAPAKVVTAAILLAVPLLDLAWLIVARLGRGDHPFAAGRDHLHFRLVDAGLDPRLVVLAYWTLCALLAVVVLLL